MSIADRTADEVAQRGQAPYEDRIRPQMEGSNKGKYIVTNVETGEYEMDADDLIASKRARARFPDAPLFTVRVGYRAAYRLGASSPAVEQRQAVVLEAGGGPLLGMSLLRGTRATLDVVVDGAVVIEALPLTD